MFPSLQIHTGVLRYLPGASPASSWTHSLSFWILGTQSHIGPLTRAVGTERRQHWDACDRKGSLEVSSHTRAPLPPNPGAQPLSVLTSGMWPLWREDTCVCICLSPRVLRSHRTSGDKGQCKLRLKLFCCLRVRIHRSSCTPGVRANYSYLLDPVHIILQMSPNLITSNF